MILISVIPLVLILVLYHSDGERNPKGFLLVIFTIIILLNVRLLSKLIVYNSRFLSVNSSVHLKAASSLYNPHGHHYYS